MELDIADETKEEGAAGGKASAQQTVTVDGKERKVLKSKRKTESGKAKEAKAVHKRQKEERLERALLEEAGSDVEADFPLIKLEEMISELKIHDDEEEEGRGAEKEGGKEAEEEKKQQ